METSEKLSYKQAVQWFTMFQFGSIYLTLPGVLARIVHQDAWISIILTLIIQLTLIIPLFISISKQAKGIRFGDYIETLLGKFFGKMFMIGFSVLGPLMGFLFTLWILSDFLLTSVLPETPSEAVGILMLVAVISVVRSGVVAIGRTGEICFLILIFFFLVAFLTLIPTFQWGNIFPLFEYGTKPILHGSVLTLGLPYCESFLLIYFIHHMEPKNWKKAVYSSTWISGLLFVLETIVTIGVLSEGVVGNLTFSGYFIMRTITLWDIIERFEILFTVLYFVTTFFRMALLLYVTADGLAGVFRMKDYKPLLLPLCLISLMFVTSFMPNTITYQNGYRFFAFYPMIYGLLIPLILWMIGLFRRPIKS